MTHASLQISQTQRQGCDICLRFLHLSLTITLAFRFVCRSRRPCSVYDRGKRHLFDENQYFFTRSKSENRDVSVPLREVACAYVVLITQQKFGHCVTACTQPNRALIRRALRRRPLYAKMTLTNYLKWHLFTKLPQQELSYLHKNWHIQC